MGFYSLDKWQAMVRRERRTTAVGSLEKVDVAPE